MARPYREHGDELPDPRASAAGAATVALLKRYLDEGADFDTAALLKAIARRLGGPEEMAAMMVEDLRAAPAGSLMRQRFWQTYLNNCARNDGRMRGEDLDGLPLEELEATLESALGRPAGGGG